MAIAEHELGIRLNQEEQEKLRLAASLSGLSLGDFAASAVTRMAEAVIARPPMTRLSNRDFDHLISLLEADTEPNAVLQQAAADYARRLAEGSLQSC